jgi:lysozyme family protein
MNVNTLIDELIKLEGGYVDHPDDHGGPTNMGITLATLAKWRQCKVAPAEVQRLSKVEAKDIYLHEYYERPGLSTLPEDIQPVAFDMSVNLGPRQAIKIIQEACCVLGNQVAIDGRIGPMTILAVQKSCADRGATEVLSQIAKVRKDFYCKLVKDNPSQHVFLAGWLNRADKFKEVA